MNPQLTSFIFPAFVSEYLGNEIEIARNLSEDFDEFLNITKSKYFPEFRNFSLIDKQFLENELFSQVSSYIFGCAIASGLKNKGLVPAMVAGNSMGLYAALYATGVVSFDDGLRLLTKASEFIRTETEGQNMGMAAIVGLELNDVENIINKTDSKISIANKNGKYSFLISGEKNSIDLALGLAKKEGALFTSTVLVDSPYHSIFLKKAALNFGNFIDQDISLKDSMYPIISSVDQQELRTSIEIREELVKNIYKPINWYDSMVNMISNGTNCFVECGAGNSLTKLARFIDSDFKVYPINKINKLLGKT